MAALRSEDTEEMSILQVTLDKAQRQAAVPPLDHQIKATEDFIGRAKKRLLQHDVVINEAQEALQKAESTKRAEAERLAEAEELLQRLRVQVPQVPRSVQDLVEQLQSERDGLANQLKNQSSTRLVEIVHPVQSSKEAAQLVLERSAKRRAVGEDVPTNQQDLACWMVSKQLELRDAHEMGEIGIIKELSQLISKGALRMECFPSMVSSMVCWNKSLRFTVHCGAGVTCGSERLRTLGLSKHEVPAGWQKHCRTQCRTV